MKYNCFREGNISVFCVIKQRERKERKKKQRDETDKQKDGQTDKRRNTQRFKDT